MKFQEGDIVKLRKNVTLKELMKNNWNHSCENIMDFIKNFGDKNTEWEVNIIWDDGNIGIRLCNKEKYSDISPLIVYYNQINPKLFKLARRKILTDKEKQCLTEYLRLFKDHIKDVIIRKNGCSEYDEYLEIIYKENEDSCNSDFYVMTPFFEKGSMFKNMKLNKEYTLQELNIYL